MLDSLATKRPNIQIPSSSFSISVILSRCVLATDEKNCKNICLIFQILNLYYMIIFINVFARHLDRNLSSSLSFHFLGGETRP